MAKVLNINGGSWVPLGHKQNPPALPKLFGPPRYTEAEQAANPDKPMTRLVKDVLRVGKWKVGTDKAGQPELWDVQTGTLAEISANFHAAQRNGVAFNLTLSHGDRQTGLVPTEELISPLDDMVVEGPVLWVSTYVTPERAKFLTNPAMKVSIGVHDDWVDGQGRVYSMAPIHVAVTDHPVVTGQGSFVELANKQTPNKRNLSMNFAAVVEQINKLLGMVHPGATLPEGTTEENLVEYLNLAMSIITGGEAPAPEAGAAEGGDVLTESLPPALAQGQDKMFALIQKAVKDAVEPQLKALSNEVKELKTDKANAAKSAFEGRCKVLLSNGVPAAALEQAKKLGASNGYDTAILDLVESTSGKLTRRPATKALANGSASPLSSDEPQRRTDEDIAESLKKRGIDPKHLPSHHPVNGRS